MLKKELKLLDVFAIATGTTLSAGFFLLPGIAAQQAGPALVLAYLIAAVPLVPAMFSIIELATAMPRAGGVYYFLDRTLGPLFGTIGGLGTWFALILKVAFALIGMGAYISLFVPELSITPAAILIAIILGSINAFGAKKSGRLQILLLFGLLSIIAIFIAGGLPEISYSHFDGFFDAGMSSIFATAGLVYISYVGVTKVASLSEEVINPERNLPLGVILALTTSILVYVIGTSIMVGVLPMEQLAGDITPVASAARVFMGEAGVIILSIAALLAFVSVANAGIMSASRYPLAMSRDHILPPIFKRLDKRSIPIIALLFTIFTIVLFLGFLDPAKIAKLASAFQLLMFALVCFAVIVMRESKIESYDPGYKSPFYPWTQILGIISPLFLIFKMGWLSIIFSIVLVLFCVLWYIYYAKKRVRRTGAIYHIFERLGKSRHAGLDVELRGILKEKGLRKEDQFEEIVMRSHVIDIEDFTDFKNVAHQASEYLSTFTGHSSEEIKKQFLEGTRIGATPVTRGVALPHLRIEGIKQPVMVLVRSKNGVHICFNNPLTDQDKEEEEIVKAVFFLVSPQENPAQHLRMLAQIAGRVDEDTFSIEWEKAKDGVELKKVLLHDERWLSLSVNLKDHAENLIGKQLKDLKLPPDTLVAIINRNGVNIIPKGKTIVEVGDKLTIIGEINSIKKVEKEFLPKSAFS
ncbi:MAG: amino acid permease [Ignavibacteriae bacterium]|nr:amino acid permease [Ignavibacteriota bacterium]NOG96881.1 amino acid permease [Ignavibacteriota bacterium]